MCIDTRKPFEILDAFPEGTWHTNVNRFYKLAHKQLARLEHLVAEVHAKWPKSLSESLKDHEISPALEGLIEDRDLAFDMARIFAAMAVEAFLNFYGAARLGEQEYKTHFERLGLVPKLRLLLLICDSISMSENDPLVKALRVVAEGRNTLVHPKATKVGPGDRLQGLWTPIPGAARKSVAAMDSFFSQFLSLNPEARHFLPIVKNTDV